MKEKKVYFVSLGCPKNLVDSEILLSIAFDKKWVLCSSPDDADLIVINTCGFLKEARRESLWWVRRCKTGGKFPVVLVTGCATRIESREISEIKRLANYVVDIGDLKSFENIFEGKEILKKECIKKKVIFPSFKYKRFLTGSGVSVYVKISDGCSRKCSFCVIPRIKGNLVSRPMIRIESEVSELANYGVREIVIISQDTTSYGCDLGEDGASLESLLKKLVKIKGVEWIRIMYLYPHRSLFRIFDMMKRYPVIVPYIDMPVQHSSDRMLRIMRRGYQRCLIEELINYAREKIPDIAIRTTLLVGHPGEKESDFFDLVGFVKKYRFERIGIMKYSDEKKADSYSFNGKLENREIQQRFRILQDVASRIMEKNNRKLINKDVMVMLETCRKNGTWEGRMKTQAPQVDGKVIVTGVHSEALPGDMIWVKINECTGVNFRGVAISSVNKSN